MVGLAVGALVVATGGLAAAALGVTAVKLGVIAGAPVSYTHLDVYKRQFMIRGMELP